VTVAADDGHAILRVRDTGIGMSKELLPRIFELFTQSERALDRSQGGLGIGLTLVRSLIEMHDGQVTAHSEGPNAGSEFIITLPRSITVTPTAGQSEAAPREAPPRAVPCSTSHNGHAHPPGRKVLIIEDQPDARRALQRLLQLWGHQVEVAADGPGGVEAATKSNPDIALVDVGLPGLDGYEVARRIRKTLGQNVRLVALTGYGQPEDKERALAAGFDLHLVKPVDSEQLAQSVGSSR
jgi:CheY-like chemotaxis protein